MTVAGDGVDVEEIHRAELAGAKFETAGGQVRSERERPAFGFDLVAAERDDLADHGARNVRSSAKTWIAYDVEISEAGEAKSIADAAAAGAFHVEEQFGGMGRLDTGVKRQHAGDLDLVVRAEAVRTRVGRVESRVALGNEVHLAGQVPAGTVGVGEHGDGRVGVLRVAAAGEKEEHEQRSNGVHARQMILLA